jgi:hypothetical protein
MSTPNEWLVNVREGLREMWLRYNDYRSTMAVEAFLEVVRLAGERREG